MPPAIVLAGGDPLQHAPLPGTRVQVTRRGCVRAVPAAPASSSDEDEDAAGDAAAADTRTYLASSQVAGQIELARRALTSSRNTSSNGNGIDRERALLLAEAATIEAQLALMDAAPGPHVERLRREEAEVLALFRAVSADKAQEDPASPDRPTRARAHVGYRKRVASLRTFLSVPAVESLSRPRNVTMEDHLEEL